MPFPCHAQGRGFFTRARILSLVPNLPGLSLGDFFWSPAILSGVSREDMSIPYVQGPANLLPQPPNEEKTLVSLENFLSLLVSHRDTNFLFQFYYPQWANRNQETLPKIFYVARNCGGAPEWHMGWAPDSWFGSSLDCRSWSQDHYIQPCTGLLAQFGGCLRFSLPLPLPLTQRACTHTLSNK